ncbi:MAG: threonine/serine exporter family protein [Planctomycetota bacterium]
MLPPVAESGPGGMAQGELGQAIAIGTLGVMLAIVFRARPKDIVPIVLAVSLGVYGARFGASVLSPELGPAIGAFVLGLFSNAWSRLRRQPAAITTIPALLPLVPGSIGFTGLNAMLIDDTMTGVDTFFTMLLVGVSLVAGLLLANVVYGPRKAV